MMGFDFELKYTPGEQIPNGNVLRRMDFNETNLTKTKYAS